MKLQSGSSYSDLKKNEDLQKALINPPSRSGEISEDGTRIGSYHPATKQIIWVSHPDIARKHDEIISKNKEFYSNLHQNPVHKQLVRDFFDRVSQDPDRHTVGPVGKSNMPKARHLAKLFTSHPGATLKVTKVKQSGEPAVLFAAVRHGKTPGDMEIPESHVYSDIWVHTKSQGLRYLKPQVTPRNKPLLG